MKKFFVRSALGLQTHIPNSADPSVNDKMWAEGKANTNEWAIFNFDDVFKCSFHNGGGEKSDSVPIWESLCIPTSKQAKQQQQKNCKQHESIWNNIKNKS